MRKDFWWVNEESSDVLSRGYLIPGKTIEETVRTKAKYASSILGMPEMEDKFYNMIAKGWMSLSSPIWANFGEGRGLPISCFSSYIPDSIDGIFSGVKEVAMMTQKGGGTSGYFGALRPRGADIKGGGKSSGAVSFVEIFDSTIKNVSQSGVRRGGFAAYMDITHPEVLDLLRIKDKDSSMQSINSAVNVTDKFMGDMIAGNKEYRNLWAEVLRNRREKGIPYISFIDNVNNNKPEVYKDLKIHQSNLCVTGDTKILTENGYEPIEEIEGQLINVWNGDDWSEVQILKTGESKEVFEVTLSNGSKIKATPYHKWYTQKGYNKGVGENKLLLEEKRTEDLQVGDKLIKFELPIIEGVKELKYAYTQGFYSGDGYQGETPMRSNIALYNEKQDLLEHFDIRNKYSGGGTRAVETNDIAILKSNTNKTLIYPPLDLIQDKTFVPNASYTIKSRLDWLAGLVDSDGTLTNNNSSQTIQIGSVNKQFLINIMLMLQTLGCDSVVRLSREACIRKMPKNNSSGELGDYNCKDMYRLLVNGNSVYKLLQLGLSTKRLQPSGKKPNRECSEFIKIEKVEKLIDLYDTYCANEPKKHQLMFEGVVTGNCNEIWLPTSEDESLVCCLSSMNLATYDEWKNTDAIETAIYFLDAVMTDFINKTEGMKGMERAHKFAKRHRALGLGVMGWHSYLQDNMIPFDSIQALALTDVIFKDMKEKSYKASEKLANILGEPELLKGVGRRHTTTMAVAPTTSSSSILGQVSPGIEPYKSNYYVVGLAKGSFPRVNSSLKRLLQEKGKDTREVIESIKMNKGSVQHLTFLDEEEKAVFKTFEEISPYAIIDQASVRQKYIDQGQSLNLMIPHSMDIKEVNKIHIEAWKKGIKGLYYQRGTSISKEALLKMQSCSSCEA